MADLKISQLSAATALAGTEVVPVVQGGSTKKATIDQILAPASGKGLNFSAAGGDTLTMYDEGTWTPVIVGSSSAGAGTYPVQTGTYTRIGDVVYIQLFLVWTAHTGTGNMFIDGLPFPSKNTSFALHAASIGQFENIGLTIGSTPMAYIANNTTQISLRQMPTGGGAMANVPIDTAGNMIISASYKV